MTLAPPASSGTGRPRVTFVHSPNPFFLTLQNNGVHFMPVWAYTLAAHLPDDAYELTLHDSRFDRIDEVEGADVFLLSGLNQDLPVLVEVREVLARRFPDAGILLGGPITWSFDQAGDLDRLSMFDHVVVGDGEPVVAALVADLLAGRPRDRVVRSAGRFDLARARPMHPRLLEVTIGRYYGAVLEVSRGCPFLCEFCDIRVLPDNNRAHVLPPGLIVEEVDRLSRLGATKLLFACDNFIGDVRWAEEVVDRILSWREASGFRPSLYTWLTIDLHKHPALMARMRRAGFDMLFVGVESFDSSSLLETAKVQNEAADLPRAVREIQSYGFFVVAGLIFGFDSDSTETFDRTLDGLLAAGLLSGDPSLLTALPGTPLYRRMRLAGRLRDVRYGLGGHKYQTNIRYLMPREELIAGFRRFVLRLTAGSHQVARLRACFDNFERGNFVPVDGNGFADLGLALRTILRTPAAVWLGLKRFAHFLTSPVDLFWLLRGLSIAASHRHLRGWFGYFQFWFALWSTVILKYRKLSDEDFDIESVAGPIARDTLLPDGYESGGDEPIPAAKIAAQRRATVRALGEVAERRGLPERART
jgi:radical SAM superfamily enzyme YgiQ (UPF0313 family)